MAGQRRWATGLLGLLGALTTEAAAGQGVPERAGAPERAALDALVQAYPDALASHDGEHLVWRDGTRMPVSDGGAPKSLKAMLAAGSILDMFATSYPTGRPTREPGPDEDPGRIRHQALFLKLYGDCRRGEVAGGLTGVRWLRGRGGPVIRVTSRQGVAERLQQVSDELERLPEPLMRYLTPIAGTYNCRAVAGTDGLSMHAYGAAIDLNAAHGDYWRWAGRGARYRNRIPYEIAEVFERHGFIWGGRWSHFDTLHFEYRPELLILAGQAPEPR